MSDAEELAALRLELSSLQRMAQTLSLSLELDEVLGLCLDLSIEAARAAAGAIYLREEQPARFERVALRAIEPAAASPVRIAAERILPLLQVPSQAFDLHAASAAPEVRAGWEAGFRRVVMLSLESDALVGFVVLGFRDEPTPPPSTVRTLEAIARFQAMAIERARAQRAARAEHRRLDLVVENLPIVVAVISRDGTVLHHNAAARRFGADVAVKYADDWRRGLMELRSLYADGQPMPVEDMLLSRAFRGERPPPREMILQAADGRRYHVLAVAAPLPDEDGEIRAVVSGFQDVSALRELADAKDRFLRIASHELRSPLTSLRASTSLLELDPTVVSDPERRRTLLERVHRQVDRLTRLIEQLIDNARLNATAPPLERSDADLVALTRDAIELVAPSGRTVQLDAPEPILGSWDPLRIEQVLTNLIGNAARYSPPDSAIVVRVHGDAERAVVEVSDRGIGIPADQQARLFTPFFRASNAAALHKGGLGLGLHIAAEIVRRHGGTLRAASVVGEGSTFTVELPRRS